MTTVKKIPSSKPDSGGVWLLKFGNIVFFGKELSEVINTVTKVGAKYERK